MVWFGWFGSVGSVRFGRFASVRSVQSVQSVRFGRFGPLGSVGSVGSVSSVWFGRFVSVGAAFLLLVICFVMFTSALTLVEIRPKSKDELTPV